jgi:sugar lactone lactonase YvrE
MKPEIWDDRACQVGEGPVAIGPNNEWIWWVDIYTNRVLFKNFETGETNGYEMSENVSFVIPCADYSQILGTANGPVRRTKEGVIATLPTRSDVRGPDTFPERWNDAKVAPDGHLWLGSMPYNWADHPSACGLYRLSKDDLKLQKKVDGISLSNGLGWTKDGKTMVYIDTMAKSIDTFDYNDGEISNRKVRWRVTDDSQGLPDGLCMDAEDGVWVAFWNGGVLRRFDKDFNLTDTLEVGVPMPTSCAFVGKNLDTLIITSAHDGVENPGKDWGKTFSYRPKIGGLPPVLFPAFK